MSLDPLASTAVSTRTRVLAYGLLGFCVLMTLFGPQIAELGLSALGCPARYGGGVADCHGLSSLLADRLVFWISAVPPVDTGFLLLHRLWSLLALWVVLIVLSLLSDRSPEAAQRRELRRQSAPEAQGLRKLRRWLRSAASAEPQPSMQAALQEMEPRARGARLRARQAEQLLRQQAQQGAEQLAHARMRQARRLGWVALGALWWVLLGGLVTFVLAFGTPLLATLNAQKLLRVIGCSWRSAVAASDACGGLGAFLTERLQPYFIPVAGPILAPIWLVTQFYDVLLLWTGLIVLLGVVLGYRISRVGLSSVR